MLPFDGSCGRILTGSAFGQAVSPDRLDRIVDVCRERSLMVTVIIVIG